MLGRAGLGMLAHTHADARPPRAVWQTGSTLMLPTGTLRTSDAK